MPKKHPDYTSIKFVNVTKDFDNKITNLAENIGYNNRNDLIRNKIKEIIQKNESILTDPVLSSQRICIDIYSIHKRTYQKLDIIAKSKGYKGCADILLDELRREIDRQPKHMLLKNKGFKEIDDDTNI